MLVRISRPPKDVQSPKRKKNRPRKGTENTKGSAESVGVDTNLALFCASLWPVLVFVGGKSNEVSGRRTVLQSTGSPIRQCRVRRQVRASPCRPHPPSSGLDSSLPSARRP